MNKYDQIFSNIHFEHKYEQILWSKKTKKIQRYSSQMNKYDQIFSNIHFEHKQKKDI